MNGKKLWEAQVGKESDPARWGSSSSPIVSDDSVIVTASAESQAIIALDKNTGKEVWRQEASGLDNMWGTPALVKVSDDRTDVVMSVAKELWGLDPETGKLRWFAAATDADQSYSSIVQDGVRVFAVTGRGGGSVAVDVAGKGDIGETNTVWTGNTNGSFGSPVLSGSKMFVVSSGVVTVVDAKTGDRLDQVRLTGVMQTGGRFGSLDYASPIVVGDRLFYLNGSGQMYVFAIGDEGLEQISVNRVTTDKETFWGSPAVSDGKLVLRGSKHLYCVADKGEKVEPAPAAVAASPATPAEGRGGGRPAFGGGRPGGGGGAGGAGAGGGGRRFDPMSMFNGMDANKDGKLTETELAGNPMADRLKTLDKDSDNAITADEFRTGIMSLFRSGSGGGGGGRSYGRGGNRPERPRRPSMAGE
jgi:outer membrane protein assembly factor BamB